jgi:hypothetical protein
MSHRPGKPRRNSVVSSGIAAVTVVAIGIVCISHAWATNVVTYHYDTFRTGWNPSEQTLTPANVGGGSFGFLAEIKLPASKLVGHPLVVQGVSVKGVGTVDVEYLFDNYNSVWALNAYTGAVLLHTKLGTPVPASDNPYNQGVGIRSTPVIDPTTQTLYVLADTYVNSTPTYMLYALSLGSLANQVPPVAVAASNNLVDGSAVVFNAQVEQQKAALLEANGNIYAAFGSFADLASNEARGWVLGWNAATLTPLASNMLTNSLASTSANCPGAPAPCYLSSIWMSGFGIAADSAGRLYFVTANGGENSYAVPNNYAESALKVSADLTTVESYFAPYNVNGFDKNDRDFGSGGLTILPTQPGALPGLAVAAGKAGIMYLMNQNNLGGHVLTPPDQVVAQATIGGCWCGQSYFTGSDGVGRIVSGGDFNVEVWKVNTSPALTLTQESASATLSSGQDAGKFTSVSSNGTTADTAIIWTIGRPSVVDGPLTLYALSAADSSTLFSASFGKWASPNINAEISPVVANGYVYIAVQNYLYILGLHGTAQPAVVPEAVEPIRTAGHEVYGTVVATSGHLIKLRLRTGKVLPVDNEHAEELNRSVEIFAGRSLGIDGFYDHSGVFHAKLTFRAKDSPALWLSDK